MAPPGLDQIITPAFGNNYFRPWFYFKRNSVRFFLWTGENAETENADVIAFPKIASGLRNSHFRPGRPVKVLIHGFADDGKTAWVTKAKTKYLSVGDCNVISVDWKDLVTVQGSEFNLIHEASIPGGSIILAISGGGYQARGGPKMY